MRLNHPFLNLLRLGQYLVSLTVLYGCQTTIPAPAKLDRIPALPQDPLIQTYMNHNEAAEYTERDRSITRSGDNLEQIIIDNINSAQTSLHINILQRVMPTY